MPAAAVLAKNHRVFVRRRTLSARSMITIYIVLLIAVPSNIVIAPLGSIGRPSVLWGLFMLAVWFLWRVQAPSYAVRPIVQPVRVAFAALLVIALISYAAALLRGQPFDQVSPATTSLVRILAWGGVITVTVDGIRTRDDVVALLRRLSIAGGLLAALGLVQFITGQTIVDFFGNIPGLSASAGGVDERGQFTRPSGTASHPLEYGLTLNAVLPVAIATAIQGGYQPSQRIRSAWLWWAPVALIAASSMLAVSRSALIGFAIALVGMLPALPRAYRGVVLAVGAVLAAAVSIAVPGILRTMIDLFADTGTDASTLSRTNGLERAPDFIAVSPWYGAGFGTFLPRYYIFDNQWILLTVELGVLGTSALVALFAIGMWSALVARRLSGEEPVRTIGQAVTVSLLAIAVLLAFFDGLSFAMAAGMVFLMVGIAGAIRNVGINDCHSSLALARVTEVAAGPDEPVDPKTSDFTADRRPAVPRAADRLDPDATPPSSC